MNKRENHGKTKAKSKQQKRNKFDVNEMAVAAPVHVQNEEPTPAIFKLNAICCDDLFEWLSLKDLHSLGQTCKRMQRLTGVYFQENFTEHPTCERETLFYYETTRIPKFITFVRSVNFFETDDDCDFQYFASNCEKLREISFFGIRHDVKATFIDCIKDKLGDIEMINWSDVWPSIRFYEDFFKFCPNLKTLRLDYEDGQHEWLCHEYPKLKNVMMNPEPVTDDLGKKLSIFLQKNEQLQIVEVPFELILKYRDIFINSSIKLKVLILKHHDLFYGLFDKRFNYLNTLLNRLNDSGFYKRLELEVETKFSTRDSFILISSIHMKQISRLRGLEKLSGKFEEDVVSPTMLALKELNIYNHIPGDINIEAFITSFPNLRKLFLHCAENTEELLPIIRHLPKLKELYIYNMRKAIDLFALNQQRKNLAEACKVTIHLCEYAYLKTKHANKNLYIDHHLIEIKRLFQENSYTDYCQ